MTFASIFTGGGGADIGAKTAGLTPIWGIEHAPDIADVARQNLGHDVICADVLTVNPRNLPRPDVLHASPPCPNFSTAKAGAEETALDIALAAKVAEFISVLKPRFFTLENVRDYAHSKSLKIIVAALNGCGYAVNSWVLNAADYGVPQTRKRLILIARRDGVKPSKPEPTHTETPTPLFDHRRQWVGWYKAIEDLIPTLPETQLATWQISKMPRKMRLPKLVMNGNASNNGVFLDSDSPAFTVCASDYKHMPKIMTELKTAFTTYFCLSRFQSFPNTYIWPDDKNLASKIIGNAVPPMLYLNILGGFRQ